MNRDTIMRNHELLVGLVGATLLAGTEQMIAIFSRENPRIAEILGGDRTVRVPTPRSTK